MYKLTVFAAALVALGPTGCGSLGSIANTDAQASSAVAAAPASSSDCHDQATSWRDNGGKSDLMTVAADLDAFVTASGGMVDALDGTADMSSAESAMQSASATLQSDAQSARADLPPACVPGLRVDEGKAMTYYATAAGDTQNAVSELGSYSVDVAEGDMNAADKAINAGNKKLKATVADLQAFNAS
jgi:hypothetical protein